MTDIRVDYGVVAAARNNISSGSNKISTTMDNMENDLRPLVEQWTGEASSAYHTSKSNWDSALRDMNNVLVQIQGLLGDSAQDFSSTDRSGANRFGG
ncbi:WXG100 family type VII secretion target [Gulosibacter macacae]|uniref:ESAT-6-like protein n=1 Tax=Gulosibacter macacae TaxID=2488791 RepID=A0A3P3VRZ4_9MICO|nr:WXG100 family type VII secretion target [Gulosibacter macacae]RRJ85551.1 WXG100 family type VII secretion target [Gulosibacter macacae]